MKFFVFLLLFLCAIQTSAASTVLTVFTLSSKTNIDFTAAGVDQKVASFLVINPTAVTFDVVLSFAKDCNVQHFRRSTLNIPITKVRIAINGGAITDFWTRAGSDCTGLMTWSPPGPGPFLDKYQVDVYISWAATPLFIAGSYAESLNINAFIP